MNDIPVAGENRPLSVAAVLLALSDFAPADLLVADILSDEMVAECGGFRSL